VINHPYVDGGISFMERLQKIPVFGGIDNFSLFAVPLFVFAGEVMGRGGIARRLVGGTIGRRRRARFSRFGGGHLLGAVPRSVRHSAVQALSRDPSVYCDLSLGARAHYLRAGNYSGSLAALEMNAELIRLH
jgi:hypothetical protein